MESLTKVVESKVGPTFPKIFAIVFDDWINAAKHYLDMFITFMF